MWANICAAIAAFAAAWIVQGWRLGGQMAEVKTEYAKAQVAAVEKAHMETIRLHEQVDNALAESHKRQKVLARDADNARRELVRLQDAARTTASRLQDTSPTGADDATALSWVLGKCAAELQDMARNADGHANDVRTLMEAWPTAR